jgi:uncharacterized protein YukE
MDSDRSTDPLDAGAVAERTVVATSILPLVPNWQPDWEDVQFQHGAASEAAAACRRAAHELDTVATTFARARRTLETEGQWQGNARDDFDTEASEIPGEISDTRDALNRLAGQLADASAAAHAEQAGREAQRQRWYNERRRELAANPRQPIRGPN